MEGAETRAEAEPTRARLEGAETELRVDADPGRVRDGVESRGGGRAWLRLALDVIGGAGRTKESLSLSLLFAGSRDMAKTTFEKAASVGAVSRGGGEAEGDEVAGCGREETDEEEEGRREAEPVEVGTSLEEGAAPAPAAPVGAENAEAEVGGSDRGDQACLDRGGAVSPAAGSAPAPSGDLTVMRDGETGTP